MLFVLPLDSSLGSLSGDCAELACNCFGLFWLNEKHIQLGLEEISLQYLWFRHLWIALAVYAKTRTAGGGSCAWCTPKHISLNWFPGRGVTLCTQCVFMLDACSSHIRTQGQTHRHFLIPEQCPRHNPDIRRGGARFYHIWNTIPLWTAAQSEEIEGEKKREKKRGKIEGRTEKGWEDNHSFSFR